ncbi:hypothetical protein AB7M49_006977 [Bradyrhizobium elkanii]
MTKVHQCQECGEDISARRRGQEFCKPSCRQAFNNRRMQRGAELYDLFRALRRERADAKALNLWTELCRLELKYQIEDETARPGRRSYMPPQKAITILKDKGSLPRGEVLKAVGRRAA